MTTPTDASQPLIAPTIDKHSMSGSKAAAHVAHAKENIMSSTPVKAVSQSTSTGKLFGVDLAYVNVVAFVINFLVVGGSNYGLWGKTNDQVSNEHQTLVTPAGYAFGIWGIIYMTETAFTVWQFLPQNRHNPLVVRGVGPWFALASVLQAVWSIAFAQEMGVVSAALLVAIATSLSLSSFRLRGFKTGMTAKEFWLVHLPIGLHAGWTVAAAIVNLNLALVQHGYGTSTQVCFAILSIFAATALAALFSMQYQDHAFLVAICWALAGIACNPGDHNDKTLGSDVAAGLTSAINIIWVNLLALVAASVLLNKDT